MKNPVLPADTSDADRLVDLMRFDGLSGPGLKLVDDVRSFVLNLLAKARAKLADGETLVGIHFFLLLGEDGKRQVGMLFDDSLPSKNAVGASIREIAKTFKVVAVVHVCEGWSLWGKVTKEEADEIMNKYDGQVSKHPRACDVAFVNAVYNVRGRPHFVVKMLKIDETQTPRLVVDEAPWMVGGGGSSERFEGRMVVPHDLLAEIE